MLRALAVAVLLVFLLPSCASTRGGPAPPPGPVTVVEVQNRNWADITVYVIRSGMRQRLGSVVSMTTERLKVPAGVLSGSEGIRLHVEVLGSRDAFTTEAIQVQPGDRVQFDVENHLAISSYSVWRQEEAEAMRDASPGEWVGVRLHTGWYGFSTCSDTGLAHAWGNVEKLWDFDLWTLTVEAAPTLAHEATHLRMIQRDGGCEAHKARRAADPRGVALDMEASAFCAASLVFARQEGVPLDVAIRKYAAWLWTYGFNLTPNQAIEEITLRCRAA